MPRIPYMLGPDGPGGLSLETAVVAVLPPGVNPTNLEINVELRETASWTEDATLVLARRRAEVLNAFLSLRPEQAEKGSERIEMHVEWAAAELRDVRAFLLAPVAEPVIHADFREYRK